MKYVFFDNQGFWGDWTEERVLDKWDSNVWYVYAMDCGNWHWNDRLKPAFWVELEAFNGGSHFSHEDSGVWILNLIMLLFFSALLGFSTKSYF